MRLCYCASKISVDIVFLSFMIKFWTNVLHRYIVNTTKYNVHVQLPILVFIIRKKSRISCKIK